MYNENMFKQVEKNRKKRSNEVNKRGEEEKERRNKEKTLYKEKMGKTSFCK